MEGMVRYGNLREEIQFLLALMGLIGPSHTKANVGEVQPIWEQEG